MQLDKVFTKELSDDSLTINEGDGVRKLSVFNASATAGTVEGSYRLNGISSTPLSIVEDQEITITTAEGSGVLDGVTITAPTGCVLQVVAMI